MSPEKSAQVSTMIAKAQECYEEGVDVLIENEFWNTSVNRLYYACFHAVSALLAAQDIDSKTHNGTRQMFGLHFVKTGIISEEMGELYSNLFSMRQKADYEYLIEYERDTVMELIEPVSLMIKKIEEVLSSR